MCGMPGIQGAGVDPDDHHAGGVSVVVRGGESLSHGEEGQFELLGKCKLPDHMRLRPLIMIEMQHKLAVFVLACRKSMPKRRWPAVNWQGDVARG